MRILWVLLGVLGLAAVAGAVEPMVWREDTQEAFSKGEPEGVSLTWDGAVGLAPVLEEVADTGEQFVWALAKDRKGGLYVATGTEGRVYRLENGTLSRVFDSPEEVAIFSLAVGPDDALYAGSSPGGVIYRIVPGKAPVSFCTTGDEHVWALLAEADGTLLAATGGKQGRILRISRDGQAQQVYRVADHNVVSLVRGPAGDFYAGTDESGLIYRIGPTGTVEVLYDAPEEEIHALVPGADGVLYAAAMSGASSRSGPAAQSQSQPQQQHASTNSGTTSALYAVRPSGAAFRLWEVAQPMLLSLVFDPDGHLIALTGDKGNVYRVRTDGAASLLTRMADVQPWAFCPDSGGAFWVGTAGAGKVYRLGAGLVREGTLTSSVRDFNLVSHWGKLVWKADAAGGTSVVFETRSGNSETPDDTWSPWSAALTDADGSQIPSPPARFLQYRARLKASGSRTPYLREVRLVGLQENVRPQVLSVEAAPVNTQNHVGGGGRSGPGADSGKGRAAPDGDRGLWKITWVAGDVNGDQMTYAVYFKAREERVWKLLEEDLTSASYTWDTNSAPEGTMQVRVVASDRPDNPAQLALTAEKVSAPFEVDHSPPILRVSSAAQAGPGTILVEGTVEDAVSPVREAAYSVNSGPWQVLFPADRIFDSRKEALKVRVAGLAPGEYSLVIRAVDSLGNTGVARAVVEVK